MVTGHDIAMSLRAAYLLMHRQTNSFLAPFDMTADQFVLLALLTEQEGITQQQLTCRASSDPNTIRAMLVLMEKKGMIKRTKHPQDKRALMVTLTPQGRRIYKKVSSKIKPLQDALMSSIKKNHPDVLIDALNRISESMILWEKKQEI